MALCDGRLEIRLPRLMRAQADAQAAVRGWTTAAYIRDAIRRALEKDVHPRPRRQDVRG